MLGGGMARRLRATLPHCIGSWIMSAHPKHRPRSLAARRSLHSQQWTHRIAMCMRTRRAYPRARHQQSRPSGRVSASSRRSAWWAQESHVAVIGSQPAKSKAKPAHAELVETFAAERALHWQSLQSVNLTRAATSHGCTYLLCQPRGGLLPELHVGLAPRDLLLALAQPLGAPLKVDLPTVRTRSSQHA